MARWKSGQAIYDKFIANLAEYVSNECKDEKRVVEFGKVAVPDFIANLRVEELTLIHEYLMYMAEMRPDIRVPTYVYHGGDRVISVTRHIQKNLELELSKLYA